MFLLFYSPTPLFTFYLFFRYNNLHTRYEAAAEAAQLIIQSFFTFSYFRSLIFEKVFFLKYLKNKITFDWNPFFPWNIQLLLCYLVLYEIILYKTWMPEKIYFIHFGVRNDQMPRTNISGFLIWFKVTFCNVRLNAIVF